MVIFVEGDARNKKLTGERRNLRRNSLDSLAVPGLLSQKEKKNGTTRERITHSCCAPIATSGMSCRRRRRRREKRSRLTSWNGRRRKMRVPSFLFLFTAETFGRKRETKMWVILFFSSSFLGSCLFFFIIISSSHRLFFSFFSRRLEYERKRAKYRQFFYFLQ